jgi:hypothetical protein
MLAQAWHAENLARHRRLPPLADYLGDGKPDATPQTPDEMKAALIAFTRAMGGTVEESA